MKRLRRLYLAPICLLASLPAALAQNKDQIVIEPLTPGWENEIVHYIDTGLSVGTNGVVVRYSTTALTAKEVSLDQSSGDILAKGDVVLQDGARLWRGDSLHYNIKTKEMSADTFRAGFSPFFAAGQELSSFPETNRLSKPGATNQLSAVSTNQAYVATNAFVTTDDVANPAYRVRAKSLKIVPGQYVEADNATVYAGNVPVMFLPYYHKRLDGHDSHWTVTPGYRSAFGPFLLSSYTWEISTNLNTALNLDYRQKRGPGVGPDVNYDLGRYGHGSASLYYTHDDEPGEDLLTGMPIPENRYRVNFTHEAYIQTNFTAKVVVRKESDPRVTRDFFESQYRNDPQPKTFMELDKTWPNFSLNVLAQPQVNTFFETVERLPDIELSAFRQQLGVSPFYYESQSSVGYFRFQPGEDNPTNSYAAYRADTYHQIVLPETFFGWLNVTPRVGGRFTRYGDTYGESDDLDLNAQNRGVFNTGAEVSFKASSLWPRAESKFWDVNGIRHIIEPSLNYVFVPNPTVSPRELPQFDTELPSLRLLPIEYPDYNAIDSIDSENVLRLSLRNKLQTKRSGEVDNLVNWALYTDWRLDPRSDQTTFADVYSDLDFKPRSWLLLSSEVRYDVENSNVNFANHMLTITPNDIWSLSLGHLYVREDPAFGPDSGNNLIRSSLIYRLNENWAVRFTHHYEARDGTLEEQYYTIYRDLRSWTAALTLRIRDNRTEPDDYTIAFTFSLKAYPRFGLGRDKAKHTLLLGS